MFRLCFGTGSVGGFFQAACVSSPPSNIFFLFFPPTGNLLFLIGRKQTSRPGRVGEGEVERRGLGPRVVREKEGRMNGIDLLQDIQNTNTTWESHFDRDNKLGL
jgi:hypothetical protein